MQVSRARKVDVVRNRPWTDELDEELYQREDQLQRVMIARLDPEIADILTAHPERITFNRGFIQNLDLYRTPITALPEGLHVGGGLYLFRTRITATAARRILTMDGLSPAAKITGLLSAGTSTWPSRSIRSRNRVADAIPTTGNRLLTVRCPN